MWDDALLYKCTLVEAQMTGSFGGASFMKCAATRADFRGSQLPGASFVKCDLTEASFADAVLAKADLVECVMKGVDLSRVVLERVTLMEMDLTTAILEGAVFDTTILIRSNLSGADFKGRLFARSQLLGANLSGCDLRGADIAGCNFKDANLAGASAWTAPGAARPLRGGRSQRRLAGRRPPRAVALHRHEGPRRQLLQGEAPGVRVHARGLRAGEVRPGRPDPRRHVSRGSAPGRLQRGSGLLFRTKLHRARLADAIENPAAALGDEADLAEAEQWRTS